MNVEANYVAKHDKLVRLLNMKVEVATPEYSKISMPLDDQIKNGMGYAHGGAIFALADVAFGAAANSDRRNGIVNMMTTIEYLVPGAIGPLVAEAHVVREGRHIVNYDVHVFDGEGTLIARAVTGGYVTKVQLPD